MAENTRRLWCTVSLLWSSLCLAQEQKSSVAFEAAAEVKAWTLAGGAALDAERGRTGGSLKLPPGSSAVWKLRAEDGAGTVTIWVYDDGTAPKEAKKRRAGPRWGIISAGGRALVSGHLYAPYIQGDTTYALGEYTPANKKEQPYHKVYYLGIRRKTGWRPWTFAFDPDKGLTVLCDGKDVNGRRKRFDWNQTKVPGFTGLVFYGDQAGADAQTVWIDDVEVQLAGAMKARPVVPPPPPPPPPVVPDKDPAVEGTTVTKLLESVRDVHPRVLFGPDEIEDLRTFYKSPKAKKFREALLAYLPSCNAPQEPKFLRDATDGQRHGYWRMPTVGLHYVLTGDRQSFQKAVGYLKLLLSLPNWETGGELDSGMSAGNIMVGAGLCFDWLYNELDPEFREQFRRKLRYHARAMYHGGHLMKNKGTHYWQNDPANNHRWHRNAGMVLCALAAADGSAEEQWLLSRVRAEMDYVAKWLPEDGTCHEGPGYLVFGTSHLTLAVQAMDRCFGTKYLEQPYFKNTPAFLIHCLQPGLTNIFPFGDAGGGIGNYAAFLYKGASVAQDRDLHAALEAIRAIKGESFEMFSWFALLWYDPDLEGGSLDSLPRAAFFDDLGLLTLRDGWAADRVGAMFKCGPFGGYRLNEFRNEGARPRYINVAHDDPDANSFILRTGGELVAETSRYSKHKKSANHNTILINGIGQTVPGRKEGSVWSQPGGPDMSKMAVVTIRKDAGDIVAIEGEAAGAYPALRGKRPALKRFRRIFVWVKGAYVLALDDVRAPVPVEIDWRMQGGKLTATDADNGRYQLAKSKATCDFQLVSDHTFEAQIVESSADNRGKSLGWQQLQARTKAQTVRYASVYDPWHLGGLTVALNPTGPDAATVTVKGPDFEDTWTWQAGASPFEPSTLESTRGDFRMTPLKDSRKPLEADE